MDWRSTALGPWLSGPALLVAKLKADPSFDSEEDRVRAFIKQGGGCRSSYFHHARKLQPPAEPPNIDLAANQPGAEGAIPTFLACCGDGTGSWAMARRLDLFICLSKSLGRSRDVSLDFQGRRGKLQRANRCHLPGRGGPVFPAGPHHPTRPNRPQHSTSVRDLRIG